VEQRSRSVVWPCGECVRHAPPYKCSCFRAQFEYYIKYINAIYYTVHTLHNAARDYTTAVIILLYNILCVIYVLRGAVNASPHCSAIIIIIIIIIERPFIYWTFREIVVRWRHNNNNISDDVRSSPS